MNLLAPLSPGCSACVQVQGRRLKGESLFEGPLHIRSRGVEVGQGDEMIDALKNIKLKILVFGPNPAIPHPLGFEADLAKKRADIKAALIADGHIAVFPEDLMTGSIDPTLNNTYLWEQLLLYEYDMVVSLVGTFGAVDELSLLHRDNLALKATLFFNHDHRNGLPFAHAQLIESLGAKLHTYAYPADLSSCSLMKQVRDKVWAVRVGKFLGS